MFSEELKMSDDAQKVFVHPDTDGDALLYEWCIVIYVSGGTAVLYFLTPHLYIWKSELKYLGHFIYAWLPLT